MLGLKLRPTFEVRHLRARAFGASVTVAATILVLQSNCLPRGICFPRPRFGRCLTIDSPAGRPDMQGLMQDAPMLISNLIEYAARYHPQREIVSR